MRRRSSMGFTARAYTFTLSSNTAPTTLASGVSSCMRLRQRSSVLLPQPDGPIMAVTVCAGNRSDTSRTARWCPKSAVSRTVSSRSRVLADATIALPRDPAGGERNDEHEAHQDERRAGDDLDRGSPPRIAQRERGLPQRIRDEAHHLFGGPGQHRNHEDRERDAARECREPMRRFDDKCPRHDTDDDRRSAVQDVRNEPHQEAEAPRSILREVHPAAHADRHADQRGQSNDDGSSYDSVRDAAARLAGGDRTPREKRPIDRRRALHHEVAQDDDEGEHGDKGQYDDERRHRAADQLTAQRARAHSALLPAGVPRATRQMRMRAIAFTATVSTKSTSPTSKSAERYMSVVASLNSFAIAAAMV